MIPIKEISFSICIKNIYFTRKHWMSERQNISSCQNCTRR